MYNVFNDSGKATKKQKKRVRRYLISSLQIACSNKKILKQARKELKKSINSLKYDVFNSYLVLILQIDNERTFIDYNDNFIDDVKYITTSLLKQAINSLKNNNKVVR